MDNISLLYRMDLIDNQDEIIAMSTSWSPKKQYEYRSQIPENNLVIGRYSVLPFYKELENELKLKNSHLINSYKQHAYIADMKWYSDIKEFTPKTFENSGYENIPYCENGYVVKGKTNSRKFKWNTCMYAKNKQDLKIVIKNLLLDSLISQQDLVIREYIPLETFEIGINGLPITNEWRFFILDNRIVSFGYYWSILDRDMRKEEYTMGIIPFVKKLIPKINPYTNFFVLDVAKTQTGQWVLIEVNDGQMSGLSTIDPFDFYEKLKIYGNYFLKKENKNGSN